MKNFDFLKEPNRKMHILPLEAYTSQEWFDLEMEKIFSKTWQFAGFKEDISEAGQYMSVQAGLNNIFIVMGRDGRLRAFHNICRHRGTQLIRSIGKTKKALTCPYHDWSYDLEGNLIGVPEEKREFENIDKKCHGLKEASVDIWRGMIFVHPKPKQAILDYFGEIDEYLGEHNIDELVEYPDTTITEEINANWKIVVENYIDQYHLSHLHFGTLAMYEHSKAKFGFVGEHFAFWEPLSKDFAEDIEEKTPYPLILPLDRLGANVPMLFPGLGLGESESSWSIFHIIPLSPTKSRVVIRSKLKNTSEWEFSKQESKSANFWEKNISGKYAYDENDPQDPMSSGDFMQEDIYACEQQQKSLKSPYFESGDSAKYGESPVRDHQYVVLGYINDEDISSFRSENSSAKKTSEIYDKIMLNKK